MHPAPHAPPPPRPLRRRARRPLPPRRRGAVRRDPPPLPQRAGRVRAADAEEHRPRRRRRRAGRLHPRLPRAARHRPPDGAAPVAVHDRPQPRARRAALAPARRRLRRRVRAQRRADGRRRAVRRSERDEMRQIVAEIARLPERQRMALVMREFDGCSHVETARRLQTTVPATKSLIIRARSNLHGGRARRLTAPAGRLAATMDVSQIEEALGRLEEGLSEARMATEMMREGDVSAVGDLNAVDRRDGAGDRRAEGPHERRHRLPPLAVAATLVELGELRRPGTGCRTTRKDRCRAP